MVRAHRLKFASLAVFMTVTGTASAQTRAVPDPAGFIRITPEQVAWQAVPDSAGVTAATILGDPNKPGP